MRIAGFLFVALMLTLGAGTAFGQSDTAWLGVALEVVEGADAKKLGIDGGLKITRVDEKSPAAKAGLEGDSHTHPTAVRLVVGVEPDEFDDAPRGDKFGELPLQPIHILPALPRATFGPTVA